jgi:hypothetical protein
MKQNKDTEIFLGGGNNIEMKSSRMVTAYQVLYLTTPTDGTITLNVKIEADFDTVPEEYYEVFMNMILKKQKVKGLTYEIVKEAFPDPDNYEVGL